MTPLALLVIVLAQGASVGGQIFMKLAMDPAHSPPGAGRFRIYFPIAMFAMTLGFFLWLGLMPRFDLSYLYPFEAVSRILLALAAAAVLKERMTPRLWMGVLLISLGVALVSLS